MGFWIGTAAALAVACCTASSAPAQTIWYVDDDAPNDPGPGDPLVSDPNEDGSTAHPFDAIQEGIDAASNGDTVVVNDSMEDGYRGTGNKDLDFGGKAITVQSQSSDPNDCVINCEGSEEHPYRAFWFHSAEGQSSVVEGFRIINGWVADKGGAICCQNSSPALINCMFSNNEALAGGAIYNNGGSPAVTDCTFSGNGAGLGGGGAGRNGGGMANDGQAVTPTNPTVTRCDFIGNSASHRGGGMANYHSANPTVTDCTFEENSAHYGAGMGNRSSNPKVVNCTFTRNPTVGYGGQGGGMGNATSSSPTVTNCSFTGNSADWGGGMCNRGQGSTAGTTGPTVTNCTFVGNSSNYGGGMYNWYEDEAHGPKVTNCTFTKNTAQTDGDGIYNNTGSPTVANCILWGDGDGLNEISDPQSTATVTYSDVEYYDQGQPAVYPGEGNINADPNFVDPTNGDYHLDSDSPCIDAACNWRLYPDSVDLDEDDVTDEMIPLDLDGESRFFDDPNTSNTGCGYPPIVDMGAYEFGGTGPQPCFGDFSGDGAVDLRDLATLLAHYDETEVCEGDLECDGDVELADLGALLATYGHVCETGQDGGDGESRGEDGGRGEGDFISLFIEPYDTGGYQGGGFHGEVDHFVFDLKIEVFDPNDDDWTTAGSLLDAHNDATFRLSSGPLVPDAYATFVAAPWVEVPGSPNGASIAGAYLPADPTHEFEVTGINIAWFDTQDSHDGPATVLRLVIDVSAVEGADVSGGFGSVYFSYWAPAEPGDILVADLRSAATSASGGGELVPLNGRFYVKGE